MSPQSEEPDRDQLLPENDPPGIEDSDATEDGSHLLRDADATVDAVSGISDAQLRSNSEASREHPDLDATYIPGSDVQSKVKEWEASLSDNSEPGRTLKSPQATDESTVNTVEQSVVLKRRDISRQDKSEYPSTVGASGQPDYRTDKLLGEGGMGSVFSARQQSMDRPVAIKVLKPRAARLKSSRQAFVSEAIITGGLDHPNIVPIYDVGKQADDALFYAMKQVEGVEWKERLATNSVDENLEILLRVSDAVAFGHARCIIHRDLKPANIMLGGFGEVLVMDWGLAMPSHDHPRRDSFPRAKRGGTPHYMAPEMADDPMLGVDRRSDVYLLGAILFEIVTGKPPHAIDFFSGTRRERVKACLAAVARNQIAETDKSGELIDIARMAMATDPKDRYQSVSEFQTAIRDYLSHEESIELASNAAEALATARQSREYDDFSRARFGFETALEQWSENSRATEGLRETRKSYAHTAFDRGDFDLALSLLDVSDPHDQSLRQEVIAAKRSKQELERKLAEQEQARIQLTREAVLQKEKAESQREIAEARRREAEAAREEEARQREFAERQLKRAETLLYASQIASAKREWETGSATLAWHHLNSTRHEYRGWEYEYVCRLLNQNQMTLYHRSRVQAAGFSTDGSQIVAICHDRTLKVWDSITGQELLVTQLNPGIDRCFALSRDCTQIFNVLREGTLKVWDAATGREKLSIGKHTFRITSLAFSPDGQRLASASLDGTVKVWDAATGQEKFALKRQTSYYDDGQPRRDRGCSVVFSPDGHRLALAMLETITIWDTATGQEWLTLKGHTGEVKSVAFGPDGTRVVSGCSNGELRVWDAATGQAKLTIESYSDSVCSVTFSPDGTRVVSGNSDGTLKSWNATTGREPLTLKGHVGEVTSVVFNPDGTKIVSASKDELRVWIATTEQEPLTLKGHAAIVQHVAFSPDGTRIVSKSSDGALKVWDKNTGQEKLTISDRKNSGTAVAFNSHGTMVVSASGDGTLKSWNATTGRETLTLNGLAGNYAFSPDGTRIVLSGGFPGPGRPWKVLDANTGKETLSFQGDRGSVECLAFSPDCTRIVSGNRQGTLKVLNATTGVETRTLTGHRHTILSVAFSPDGHRLASASLDNTVKVWDLDTGQEKLTLTGHADLVRSVAFSPDGKRIVSGSRDNTVKVWEATTGAEMLTIQAHSKDVSCVAFSPDGNQIVSGSWDGTSKLWDATPRLTVKLEGHTENIECVTFSPDSKRVVSGGESGTLIAWETRTGQKVFHTQGHMISLEGGGYDFNRVACVAFSPDGMRIVSGASDNMVRVWGVDTGQEELTLNGHSESIDSVLFSSDGTRIVSRDDSGKTLVWDATTGRILDDAPPGAMTEKNRTSNRQLSAVPCGNYVLLVREYLRTTAIATSNARHAAWVKVWHEEGAAKAESTENWFAACFHLVRLVKLIPNEPNIQSRLKHAEDMQNRKNTRSESLEN